MIKYCDIKAAKPRSVKKMVRRRRSTTAQEVWKSIYRQTGLNVQPLKTQWAGLTSPQRRSNGSSGKSALWVKGRTQTWCSSTCPCFTLFFFLQLPFITLMITCNNRNTKERKWTLSCLKQPPPLISIYRNTIIPHSHMQSDHALCSVSKVNLVTLSLEPLYIQSHNVNTICTPRHFLQTTIICFKSEAVSLHLFFVTVKML